MLRTARVSILLVMILLVVVIPAAAQTALGTLRGVVLDAPNSAPR